VYVLAHVHAPNDISPLRVKTVELALEKDLQTPVELFIRTTLSRDISSTGSINQVMTEGLDGFFDSKVHDPQIVKIKVVEQTIREFLAERLGLYVREINLLPLPGNPFIFASVLGSRSLTTEEVQELEAEIQQRSGDDSLILVIRHIDTDFYARWGQVYYEWASLEGFTAFTEEQNAIVSTARTFLEQAFENSDYFLTNISFSFQENLFRTFVELAGLKLFSQEEWHVLQEQMTDIVGSPVQVFVRSRPEVVVSEGGYSSFETFKEESLKDTETLYQEEIHQLLEEAL
jgi:hypothetical protein